MYYFRLSLFVLIHITNLFFLSAQPATGSLDTYFEQALADWGAPGMSVAIVKDGEVVLSKGYGVLEAGKEQAPDGNTIYAIASNSKAFIATAIGMLVAEGKLNWDDPVRKHLPYFRLYDAYVSEHTTVRDLLCHRVGLGTFSGDVIWYKSHYTPEEVVRRAQYVPQDFEYRAGYGYTNLMFVAAGEVIRAVTGRPWDAYVRERIFGPLGMDRTRSSVETLRDMNNVASPHKPVGDEHQPIPYVNWDNMGAAGGILSSVNDMAKWMQLQLDQGRHEGEPVFTPMVQQEMWTPHNSFQVSAAMQERYPGMHFSGYGLGWRLFDYGARKVVTHSGGYDGMYSRVALVPEENLGIVVLTNSMTGIGTYLMYRTLDHYFGMEAKDWSSVGLAAHERSRTRRSELLASLREQRVENTSPTLPLEKYTGRYHDPMYGDIEIQLDDEGQLYLHFPHASALDAELSHWHYDTYQINWKETHAWFDFGTLQFVTDNNRRVIELRFDVPNGDIFFHEIHARKVEEE